MTEANSEQTGGMTDEELVAMHQRYLDQHKQAFRAAFDLLRKHWPPKCDPEWFTQGPAPDFTVAYDRFVKDDNRIGMELLVAVYHYMEGMAVRFGKGKSE